jgi:hypothetical protein
MRKRILYCHYSSIWRCIRNILIIGCLTHPLYPQIGIGLGRSSIGVFRKSVSFIVYWVSIKVKVFAPESAKAEVKTWYLLRNKVQGIVQLFPLISRPRLIYNILIPFNPREESSFKVPLFLTLYYPLKLIRLCLLLPLLGNPL